MTTYVRARIVRWVGDDFPGFVECRFADRLGREWVVIEKIPVLTKVDLRSDSPFPQPAFIACDIVARGQDNAGREVVHITTKTPFGIESTDGQTNFQVHADQIELGHPL